jgi:hypothetical protein
MALSKVDIWQLFDIPILLLIGMEPKVALVPFLHLTAGLDSDTRREVANRMVWTATTVTLALLIFGGATMKQFVAVLLVGLLSGTYSSIFNAVPLLVVWETGKLSGRQREAEVAA